MKLEEAVGKSDCFLARRIDTRQVTWIYDDEAKVLMVQTVGTDDEGKPNLVERDPALADDRWNDWVPCFQNESVAFVELPLNRMVMNSSWLRGQRKFRSNS